MFRQRKHYNKTPSRRKIPGPGAQTFRGTRVNIIPIFTESATPNTFTRLQTNTEVYWNGMIPPWTSGSSHVIAVTVNSLNDYAIEWSGTVQNPNVVSIPFEDPTFRDRSGGYLQSGDSIVQEA